MPWKPLTARCGNRVGARIVRMTEAPDTHFAPRPFRPPRDRLPPSSEGLGRAGDRLAPAGSRSAVPLRGAGRRRGLGASGRVLARAGDRAGPGPDSSRRAGSRGRPARYNRNRFRPPPSFRRRPWRWRWRWRRRPRPPPPLPWQWTIPGRDHSRDAGRLDRPSALQSPQRRGLVDRGTLCGGVAAKPFAEALQAHDEMVAQPESRNRQWLYRVLDGGI